MPLDDIISLFDLVSALATSQHTAHSLNELGTRCLFCNGFCPYRTTPAMLETCARKYDTFGANTQIIALIYQMVLGRGPGVGADGQGLDSVAGMEVRIGS
jgi:hypothetical protein